MMPGTCPDDARMMLGTCPDDARNMPVHPGGNIEKMVDRIVLNATASAEKSFNIGGGPFARSGAPGGRRAPVIKTGAAYQMRARFNSHLVLNALGEDSVGEDSAGEGHQDWVGKVGKCPAGAPMAPRCSIRGQCRGGELKHLERILLVSIRLERIQLEKVGLKRIRFGTCPGDARNVPV